MAEKAPERICLADGFLSSGQPTGKLSSYWYPKGQEPSGVETFEYVLASKVDKVQRQRDGLLEAAKRWHAGHPFDCSLMHGHQCDCGLEHSLQAAIADCEKGEAAT